MNRAEVEALLAEHPEMAPYIQYVKPSRRQREYWRVKGDTVDKRKATQMLKLSQAAYSSYGMRGFEEVDGQVLPVVAAQIKRAMKGKRLPPKPSDALKRLQQILVKIGKTVEART